MTCSFWSSSSQTSKKCQSGTFSLSPLDKHSPLGVYVCRLYQERIQEIERKIELVSEGAVEYSYSRFGTA